MAMKPTDDPWDDPQTRRWVRRVQRELLPMIQGSRMNVTVAPSGEPDIKLAVELGLSILLDKPIIVAMYPTSWPISEHFRRVADEVLIMSGNMEADADRLQAAMKRIIPE